MMLISCECDFYQGDQACYSNFPRIVMVAAINDINQMAN